MAVDPTRRSAADRLSSGRLNPYSELRLPRNTIRMQTVSLHEGQLRDLLVRNPLAAIRWIKAAAQVGIAPAQVVWGQLLLDGTRVAAIRRRLSPGSNGPLHPATWMG